ncbi:hypothetical protein BaRGS_00034288 [Batillaria attramentaria]|uniref:MACPF domain-containing protein n=1 Tax=Batillaria attramentaria TaxID=370345 RepID=A0ABD0JIE6_9CAEN
MHAVARATHVLVNATHDQLESSQRGKVDTHNQSTLATVEDTLPAGARKLQTTHPPVTLATGTSCSNVIPGLFRQSRGVDVSRLELMPLDMMESEDGFRSPVIEFTCDKGNTRPIGGVAYDQPDQVWLVSNIPSGSMTGSVQIMTNTNEVRESFDAHAGVGVNTRKFAFSASSSYSKVQNTVLKKEKNAESLGATFSSRQIELQHVDVLALGVDAQVAGSSLISLRFISQFGTHYISEAKFGGLMMIYTETNAIYQETHDEETVSTQVTAVFGQALEAKGGTSSSTATIDSTFTSSSTETIRYFGGEANLMVSDGLAQWQPTIDTNPWLFSTKLVRISELIRDSSKKVAMSQAIDDYLMRQYVTVELVRVLDTLPPTAQTYPEVADLRKRIDEMSKKYPLVESEVVALGEDVDYWYRMLLIRYDNSMAEYTKPNNYDGELNVTCPASKTITAIKSWHSNYYEDRQWQFRCSYTPGLRPLSNCRWTDYVNSFDGDLNYKCPGSSAIKGWYSVHSSYYEDRRHKFMCCEFPGLSESVCKWDENYQNSMDGGMDVVYTPSKQLLRGAYSYHSNHYEDRRWKFEVCDAE